MVHSSFFVRNAVFTVVATCFCFCYFVAGSPDNDALPVELILFSGSCLDGVVDITWSTASEFNSAYFDLERSRDGVSWEVINTQDAAGESTETLEYYFRDATPNGGNFGHFTPFGDFFHETLPFCFKRMNNF